MKFESCALIYPVIHTTCPTCLHFTQPKCLDSSLWGDQPQTRPRRPSSPMGTSVKIRSRGVTNQWLLPLKQTIFGASKVPTSWKKYLLFHAATVCYFTIQPSRSMLHTSLEHARTSPLHQRPAIVAPWGCSSGQRRQRDVPYSDGGGAMSCLKMEMTFPFKEIKPLQNP